MRTLLLAVTLAVGGCATPSSSAGEGHHAAKAATGPLVKPGEAKLGDTTTCPVSGDTFVVEADSPKAQYNGKTYYFCCNDCPVDFLKDPAKYTAKFQ